MKNDEKFTVLELWQERGFPDIHCLLSYAGINIAACYKARNNTLSEKIKVREEKFGLKSGKTIEVNQYPVSFKKKANTILNRIQAKYKNKPPKKEELKEEQMKVKRLRVKKSYQKINVSNK